MEAEEVFDGVIVVGAGLSGCSTTYHLVSQGVKVLLLEAGVVGWGDADADVEVSGAGARGDESRYKTGVSGTAGIGVVKMIVTQPPSSISEFVRHHGEEGGRLYLHMSQSGLELEKRLAAQVAPATVRSQGSLCVAFPHHAQQLEQDYKLYKKLGCEVELYDQEMVSTYHGAQAGFVRGLFFPRDGIIHSANFSKALLEVARRTGLVTLRERCPRVVSAVDHRAKNGAHSAVVTLASGARIRARFVVLATGGLFIPDDLKGILRPCWSYFSYLKASKDSFPQPYPCSPNFFTFDFSHDWCVTDGEVRISGEDHFSGMKPPRWQERCERLEAWLRERYPDLSGPLLRTHYGIYSDTPDALPLLGRVNEGSSVCYLLGCNAWGQSVLSYCSSLVPALLGLSRTPLSTDDQKLAKFLSPTRFSSRSKM